MFCHKCGSQSIEGSAFCQKCGAKLISDDNSQQTSAPTPIKPVQPQAHDAQTDKPKKKKTKKLPFILGAVALVIVVIIIAASSGGGQDYIATVKAWKPFGSSEINATYGQVVNKFIDSITWEENVVGQGEASVVTKGKITIDAETHDIMLAVAVSPGATSDMSSMRMVAGSLGGETFSVDEVEEFVSGMFVAFDEGLDSFAASEGMPSEDDVSLSQTYTNEGAENSNSGEVLYNGISLSGFLGEPIQEWVKAFGEPDWEHEWFLMYEDKFAPQFDSQNYPHEIYAIEGITPNTVEINGITLDKTRAELVSIFGEPSSEYFDEGYGDTFTPGYNYTYDMEHYSFTVTCENDGDKPYAVAVRQIYDYYDDAYGYGGDDGGYDSGFDRTLYFTGVSHTDLLRNPDTYAYSNVYFARYKVIDVLEPKVYLAKDAEIISSGAHIIIDDRNNSGTNAIVGDIVTVYGNFTGLTMMNWSDGSSSQVPVVYPVKLIFNNITPDMADFAQALVANLNADPYSIARDNGEINQYMSGTTVRLLCKRGSSSLLTIGKTTSPDGYNFSSLWRYVPDNVSDADFQDANYIAKNQANIVRVALSDFGIDPSAISYDSLFWVTCDVMLNTVWDGTFYFHLNITNIERYE